jgi:hypothetical protein
MRGINRGSLIMASGKVMKRTKTTKITVETERLISISRPQSTYALCEICGDEVRLMTVNEAAATASVNSLSIYRLVESGKLHYAETGAGELLVCAVSFMDLHSKLKG